MQGRRRKLRFPARARESDERLEGSARGKGSEAGRDNNVPFIRQNGPVQKLQYPDNPWDACSRKSERAGGREGGGRRMEKAGPRVRADMRVPLAKGQMCGRNRGVVSGPVSAGGGQSADFSAGIAEFQWTRWPRKPIAVHLPFSLLFFLTLCFEKSKRWAFNPYTTRCCGWNRPATATVPQNVLHVLHKGAIATEGHCEMIRKHGGAFSFGNVNSTALALAGLFHRRFIVRDI